MKTFWRCIPVILLSGYPISLHSAPSSGLSAIPTFQCIGIYWSPADGAAEKECEVRYRPDGQKGWKDALPLWFDKRNSEYRGSIVSLRPGTGYEIRLSLKGASHTTTLKTSTWREDFPIVKTIYLPERVSKTYAVTNGGTKDGYILYTSQPDKKTVIDVENKTDYCLTVSVPFVIIRGLTLKNAGTHGIRFLGNAHDVVIEGCDISGWGRVRDAARGWGMDCDSAIFADQLPSLNRVVIQRNRLHHPRYTCSSWKYGHTQGPQGISFNQCGGNHVIRYNDIYGDETHYFNDGIGGAENFSREGFPNADSDVHENFIQNVMDDAIEAEGGDRNVRIWGNYMDRAYTGVSSACCSVGPLYIFRNVMGVSRCIPEAGTSDKDDHGPFGKLGDHGEFGGGRRYYFHNTLLQPPQPREMEYTLGAGNGLADSGGAMSNTVSRNNIWHVHKNWWASIADRLGNPDNDFDYDLYNGKIEAAKGAEPHGIRGVPIYSPGNGPESGRCGKYQLAPESPGFHKAVRLPDFNDDSSGDGPDIGAHESGTHPMKFGINAGEKQ